MIGWKKALGIAATVVGIVVVGATFFLWQELHQTILYKSDWLTIRQRDQK